MSFWTTIKDDFEKLFSHAENPVENTVAALKVVIAGADIALATVPGAEAILAQVNDGLTQVDALVQAGATATSWSGLATAFTGFAQNLLVATNDAGIKNANLKATIAGIITAIGATVSALESAAASLKPASAA